MCANAFTDPELNIDNDLSYIGIGECEKGYRMLPHSGDGRPTTILVEKWFDGTGRVSTIGDYYNGLTDRDLICKALDCDLTDLLVYHPDEDTPVKSRSGAPLREQPPKE